MNLMDVREIDTKNRIATWNMKKLIFTLAFPMMVSMMVQSLYNFVDSIFVARISETAFSATSLGNPIQQLMMAVSVGTGIGISSLLSRRLGAGLKKDCDNIAVTGLLLSVASCLFFVLFGVFFTPTFIRAFSDDEQLVEMGVTYLSICMRFSLGIFIATMAERLLQATGNTFLSMIAQASGAVANCILDPIMIFGYFGCPRLGIAGAAWATVIGQWIAAAVALILNFRKNHEIHFDFRNFRLRADIIRDIYKVGVPAMLGTGLTSVHTMIVNKILIGITPTAVAFYGLFHKVQTFVLMPMNGISQALVPIMGYSYGAKRGFRMREAFRTALTWGCCIMAVFMTFIIAFPQLVLQIFSATPEMLEMGIPGLRILIWGLVCLFSTGIIANAFIAMGRGGVNLINTLVRNILPIPFIYLLARSSGTRYIWWVVLAADILTFVYCVLMYRRADRTVIAPLIYDKSFKETLAMAKELEQEAGPEQDGGEAGPAPTDEENDDSR